MADDKKYTSDDFRTLKGIKQNLEDIAKLEEKGYKSAVDKNKLKKEELQFQSRGLDIEKKIESIQDSVVGKLLKQKGVEKELVNLGKLAEKGTKKEQEEAQKILNHVEQFAKGQIDNVELTSRLAENYGDLDDIANAFGKTIADGGKDLEDTVKTSSKLKEGFDSITQSLLGFDIGETLSFAGVLAAVGSFIMQAKEVRKELGTSVGESARLAGNMKLASFQAFLLGGDTEQAAQAVTALNREFGNLGAVTPLVARQAASITAQFGIGGENLGRLTKQMSVLNGASLETNLNTLETVGNLARAERVAPADVLNDMAESTETFAKFSMDGGKNLARAAIEARKLGLNLQAVDKISESILDIEGSIEKQMEASVLLGRQINLDIARQLAIEGDLEGVLAEVKNQVGGAEQLSKMNVIQRKALADAVGLEVSELSKLAAGQEKVTTLISDQNMQLLASFGKFVGIGAVLGAIIGMITLGAATPAMASGALTGAAIGALAGVAGFGAMKGAQKMNIIPKAQTGGVVRETGMAVVHKGETIAGTQFGGRESNKLLKQILEQNATLMNRLTNKVGDLALSS